VKARTPELGSIQAATICEVVKDLCIKAATVLPDDVVEALKTSRLQESEPVAVDVLDMILENAQIARTEGIPICQDTGVTHVFLEVGQDARVVGDLYEAVSMGVARGYTQGYLRKSVVRDPLFARANTGDNAPPVIHVDLVPGRSDVKITVMPKGTGSENMSGIAMLTPAAGPEGVAQFVIDTVKKAGPNACPPLVIGVGIGGMMDYAALLAKKALLRPIGRRNPEPRVSALEEEILTQVNRLGIGPGGLGGRTTALAVAIETYPTHIGALPVAVNLQCHAARSASASIGGLPNTENDRDRI
jgi:fumarate hydratase subunit alpha